MRNRLKNLRNEIFWLLDSIKSKRIRKHYGDVKYHFFNSQQQESKKIRTKYLATMIAHAVETVPFYRALNVSGALADFPIVNKLTFLDNSESMLSGKFKAHTLKKTTTSGSTGIPFIICKDRVKLDRHKAENIFFSELANHRLGSKLYYTRVWNKINSKSLLNRIFTNIVQVDISNLSDKNLSLLLEKIERDESGKSILGFSSVFEAVAKFIRSNKKVAGNRLNVDSIVTMSESLDKNARTVLAEYFNCPVISRYSNMENGFIAQQDQAGNDRYLINHGSIIVEILEVNSDVAVKNGDFGRIVITDLFNFAMPFIRYDTGDLGILDYDAKNGYGNYLKIIEGRRTDCIFNTNRELLSTHVITNTMWNYPEVSQFQFIQLTSCNYKVILNYKYGKFEREDELKNALKLYLGDDASISMDYVSEIPLLSSGKRRKVINMMSGT